MHTTTNPTTLATARVALAAPSHAPSALHAESTKLRTVRATWLTAFIAVFAALALGLLNSLSKVKAWEAMTADERLTFDATSTALIGVLFGALALGALGVRTITSEYSTGMIRTTMTAIPRRTAVLLAKVAVVAGVAMVAAVIANILGFAAGQAVLRGEHIDASISNGRSVAAILLGATAAGAFAALGVGLGALVKRASVANILIALVVIGGQIIGTAMPTSSQRFLPFNALQATVSVNRGDELLTPVHATLFIIGYAVAAVLAAAVVIRRRDV